jgi:hypothetical protein
LSDLSGASRQAILDAILAGERNPVQLAQLCNFRVKSPREKVAKALEGDYRPEHVFTLKQSLDGYRYYQKLIDELDREIQRLMHTLPSAVENGQEIPQRTKHSACQRQGGEFFRRMRAKLATAQAITATAHKIARFLYHVLLTKEPYVETVFHKCDEHTLDAQR